MKQKLKLLAKWYGVRLGKLADLLIWNERYINTLDMLEDKMWQEARIICLKIFYLTETEKWIAWYYLPEQKKHDILPTTIDGIGKTKNEARLNAILNYVEGLK